MGKKRTANVQKKKLAKQKRKEKLRKMEHAIRLQIQCMLRLAKCKTSSASSSESSSVPASASSVGLRRVRQWPTARDRGVSVYYSEKCKVIEQLKLIMDTAKILKCCYITRVGSNCVFSKLCFVHSLIQLRDP